MYLKTLFCRGVDGVIRMTEEYMAQQKVKNTSFKAKTSSYLLSSFIVYYRYTSLMYVLQFESLFKKIFPSMDPFLYFSTSESKVFILG